MLNGPTRPIKKVASLKRSDDVEKRATLPQPWFGWQSGSLAADSNPWVTGCLVIIQAVVQLNDLLVQRSRGCSIILDTLPVTWIGHSIRPPAIERDYSRTWLIFLMPTVSLLSLDDPASIWPTTSCRSIKNVGFRPFPPMTRK